MSRDTHRVEIDVAAEAVHVEHQPVVDEIHGEPDAQKAERHQPEILGAEQFAHAGRRLFRISGWLQQLVQVVRQGSVVEGGSLFDNLLDLGDATLAQQPPRRLRKYEPGDEIG